MCSTPSLAASKQIRIASATLASDEILLEVLKRCHQLDRLIALSTVADNAEYSNITKESNKVKTRVGDSIETIAKLKPSHVITANYSRPQFVDQLKKIGIHTIQLKAPQSIKDVAANIEQLGSISGCQTEALALKQEFLKETSQAEKNKEKAESRPRILPYFPGGTTAGSNTTIHDAIVAAGAVNEAALAGLTGWPKPNPEAVAILKPDFILMAGDKNETANWKALASLPGWSHLPAVQKKRLIIVEQRLLTSASHHLKNAIRAIARQLEPSSHGE